MVEGMPGAEDGDKPAGRSEEPVLASDTERDAAIRSLSDACSAGRLTLDEFEERIDRALAARRRRDLEQILADLPVPVPLTPDAMSPSRAKLSLSVIGGMRRHDRWTLPQHMVHVALLGGTCLNLGAVELPGPEATITIFSVLGGIRVRLPETVRTEVTGVSLLGGRRIDPSRAASSNAPLIRLKIFSILAGVRVDTTRDRRRQLP